MKQVKCKLEDWTIEAVLMTQKQFDLFRKLRKPEYNDIIEEYIKMLIDANN